jgi:hypothetical protein
MAQVVLDGSGILAAVGKMITAAMPQHSAKVKIGVNRPSLKIEPTPAAFACGGLLAITRRPELGDQRRLRLPPIQFRA